MISFCREKYLACELCILDIDTTEVNKSHMNLLSINKHNIIINKLLRAMFTKITIIEILQLR